MSYTTDREWSDQFIPQLKQIVGPLLLDVAPISMDQQFNTDLIVLQARNLQIACRVRRFDGNVRPEWLRQFTIRASRDSGAETEASKIANGYGHWLVYGWAKSAGFIDPWVVINLDSLRFHRDNPSPCIQHGTTPNGDGTHFHWFDFTSFPAEPPIIVARSSSQVVIPRLF
jgi:hypothetical protein